jgi:putative SOS response-associated peptidase YedK
MCGRATYKVTWKEIVALYQLTLFQPAVNTRARYNVCPTTTVDAIMDQDGKRRLDRTRWGLIPSWWSKPLKAAFTLAGFGAAASARFAAGHDYGLPSRSSRSERRLVGEVGLEPTKA